jgi:hypothetical protein
MKDFEQWYSDYIRDRKDMLLAASTITSLFLAGMFTAVETKDAPSIAIHDVGRSIKAAVRPQIGYDGKLPNNPEPAKMAAAPSAEAVSAGQNGFDYVVPGFLLAAEVTAGALFVINARRRKNEIRIPFSPPAIEMNSLSEEHMTVLREIERKL